MAASTTHQRHACQTDTAGDASKLHSGLMDSERAVISWCVNFYEHFNTVPVSVCLFWMQPDRLPIYRLLCRWRDAQKHKSFVNVTYGSSNCTRTKEKESVSAAGWPPGAFKSYFAYSVSEKHTQIALMSHTKPHDGKMHSAATVLVSPCKEMWSTCAGYYSARTGGEIQPWLTVIGMEGGVCEIAIVLHSVLPFK